MICENEAVDLCFKYNTFMAFLVQVSTDKKVRIHFVDRFLVFDKTLLSILQYGILL